MDPWPFLSERNAVRQESNGIWFLLTVLHVNPINKDSILMGVVGSCSSQVTVTLEFQRSS